MKDLRFKMFYALQLVFCFLFFASGISFAGFGTPSIMQYVGIPKFDSKNKLYQKLAEISKKCHQLKSGGKEKEIEKLEKENDELVKQLFGIKT